jgi:hypothetical protein
MLKVTGGRWPRNVPIPWAAGEDIFTSRLVREMKIFPYGRNIAAVVSAVMDKDRQDAARKRRDIAAVVSVVMDKDHQDAARKRRAFTRVRDPSCKVKRARGGAKSTAPGSSKPPPAAKSTVPGPSKSSAGSRVVASSVGKTPSAKPTKEQRPPLPVRTGEAAAGGADFDMDIYVEDYRVGGVMMFDAHMGQGLVGEFFNGEWVLNKILVQGRMLGSWLLSRLWWRPLRPRRRLERRVFCRTHGPNSVPAARFRRPPPLKTWRALCPSS